MDANRKPRDDELDVYGLTHQGKVRADNQDQFLIATLHRHLQVRQTSLSDIQRLPISGQRVAILSMVADGVGGGVGGQRASAMALETVTEYLTSTSDCFLHADSQRDEFIETLQAAALKSHQAVKARAQVEAGGRSMATTLTLYMGVWPRYYMLQVGDSRYYLLRDGELTQVTRDQTIAQELVDKGVLTPEVAEKSRLADVLSSAIGADEALPVVTRHESAWGLVHLLCTDGLTKHVSDARIGEVLRGMTSSQQACEQLLQEALDGGGSDNITMIIGRTRTPTPP